MRPAASLKEVFERPFDAQAVEERLRSVARRSPFRLGPDLVPTDFRPSSVLICFWREDSDLRVLLTRRADTLRGHPGQMAFPGGRLEPGEDWIQAALRETEEEVGIPSDQIEVLGRLDDAWSGARYQLVPIIGWLPHAPVCVPNPDEVSEVHMPVVSALLEANAHGVSEIEIAGETFVNETLTWPEGELFGLSTDLLIEALEWGLGIDRPRGPERERSLRAYLRRHSRKGDPT